MKPTERTLASFRISLAAALVLAAFVAAGPSRPAHAGLGDCGQPITTSPGPLATDCLFILQAAVGIITCSPECICAPKGSLPISATDALLCLQIVTSVGGSLNCPCAPNCEDADAPTCGGECEDEGVCAPNPFDPTSCECLDECDQAAAPQCNAQCEDGQNVCQPVSLSVGGAPADDHCACLPDGIITCANAQAPDCQGVCSAGALCQNDGGSCTCTQQPVQDTCAQAQAPGCGGTCPDGFICENTGGTCGCEPFTGQAETCGAEDAPMCGGACADGDFCGVEIGGFGCECFEPCELSTAPACGGECLDDGETCTVFAAGVNGGTLEFCGCVFE